MAPLLPRSIHALADSRSLPFAPALNHLLPRGHPSENLTPTATLKPRTLASLLRRQQVTVTATSTSTSGPKPIIPANYSGLNTGPPPGEVVGIVFGSVAGLLLLLWLIYTCATIGNLPASSSVVEEDVVIRRRSRSPRRHSVSSRSRSEVIEVSRTRERSRSRSRSHSPTVRSATVRSVPRRESTRRETTIIEEVRRPSRPPPEDDIVEVIEDPSPPPTARKSSRRQSGFRTIDPDAFGGGDRPMRKVSRH